MIYTEDKNRILFARKLESLGIGSILENIRNINWSDYVYNGYCELMNAGNDEFERVMIEAKLTDNPYVVVGGAVYFLYKQIYPDDKRLMDPTGDVDIQINIPKVVSIDNHSDIRSLGKYYISTSKKDNTLNELTLDYMTWCLDKVYNFFEVDDDLEEYDYENDTVIMTITKENKLYFSIVQEPNMIKVQVECKLKGMDKPDHLLELVLAAENNFCDAWDNTNTFYKKIQTLNGFPVQKFDQLVNHNISAIDARFELINDPNTKHKLYNHIGRVRYLNHIYPMINQPMSDEIKRLLYFLWTNRVKIYSYNYEPSMEHREFMMSMVGHFYNRLSESKGSFIVTGGNRKTMSISDVVLKDMYKPLFESRGRSLFRNRTKRRLRSRGRQTRKML